MTARYSRHSLIKRSGPEFVRSVVHGHVCERPGTFEPVQPPGCSQVVRGWAPLRGESTGRIEALEAAPESLLRLDVANVRGVGVT